MTRKRKAERRRARKARNRRRGKRRQDDGDDISEAGGPRMQPNVIGMDDGDTSSSQDLSPV